MSWTRNAACREMAALPAGFGASQTTFPSGPMIWRIIRGGTRTPPFAIAPYADVRSIGRTSTVPSAPARPAWRYASRPPVNRMPKASAVLSTWSLPTRSNARMAGMLREYWRALRTRTGPPPRWVRVARRPALARVELGRHVEQQAAGGQPSGIERACVEDRLERGSGLARAV